MVNDLGRDGVDAVGVVFPKHNIVYERNGSFLALGGLSNKTTVMGNEGEKYGIYLSDRYGFNNPIYLTSTIFLPPNL